MLEAGARGGDARHEHFASHAFEGSGGPSLSIVLAADDVEDTSEEMLWEHAALRKWWATIRSVRVAGG